MTHAQHAFHLDHPDAFVALQQEAVKSQMLSHPNIVTVYDFDRDGDLDFYVTSAEVNAPIQIVRGGANRLFRNDGDGQFAPPVAPAGG